MRCAGLWRSEISSPAQHPPNRGAQGGFEDGGFAVGNGNADFAERFVLCLLPGKAHQIGRAVGIGLIGQFEGTVGSLGLVEELRLSLPPLQGREDVSEIGESPLHRDFVLPVELLVPGLRGGIDEDARLFAIPFEANNSPAAATVRLVDRVVKTGSAGGLVAGILGVRAHVRNEIKGWRKKMQVCFRKSVIF